MVDCFPSYQKEHEELVSTTSWAEGPTAKVIEQITQGMEAGEKNLSASAKIAAQMMCCILLAKDLSERATKTWFAAWEACRDYCSKKLKVQDCDLGAKLQEKIKEVVKPPQPVEDNAAPTATNESQVQSAVQPPPVQGGGAAKKQRKRM